MLYCGLIFFLAAAPISCQICQQPSFALSAMESAYAAAQLRG